MGLHYSSQDLFFCGIPSYIWIGFIDLCLFGLGLEILLLYGIEHVLAMSMLQYPKIIYVLVLVENLGYGLCVIIWTGLMYAIYPGILVGLAANHRIGLDGFFKSVIAISGLDLLRVGINILARLHLLSDNLDDILDMIHQENLLIDIETAGWRPNNPFSWLDLEHFHSPVLQALDKGVDLEEDALNHAKIIISKYTDKPYLGEVDFINTLPPNRIDDIMEFLNDDDDMSQITVEELAAVLLRVYDLKKSLMIVLKTKTLQLDIISAINAGVTIFLCCICFTILFCEPLLDHPVSWYNVWISFCALLVSISLAFGDVFCDIFYSCFMILGVKPFVIGDKIQLSADPTSPIYTVEYVGVLNTRLSLDGAYAYIQNSLLYRARLVNRSRGTQLTLRYKFDVPGSFTKEKIEKLQSQVRTWIEQQKRLSPSFSFFIHDFDGAKFTLNLVVHFNQNWKWANEKKWGLMKDRMIVITKQMIEELSEE
eukprot:TRINITY_DN4841_c0_g1_i4.p1 TRINITY_DN4841_c0_g1~~TRINITY_DN4841_c0_g1_i4.p1  ORF type:complete len:481 (-),score=80.13 TRINITY_DN4841_c0_g1_i4:109-1551(-)